ncbi:unnamed protein product [Aphis gossypii]|uniref:Uncharacterized protein n=1 Tax=Aphis gossypii TaxID=80765 RepID=A0A9P0NLF3_APHGO|nr:unnamed protein product [Aphis gossypii]
MNYIFYSYASSTSIGVSGFSCLVTHIHILHIDGNIESNTRPCIMLNCFNKSIFNCVCELCILTIVLYICNSNFSNILSCNCKNVIVSSSLTSLISMGVSTFSCLLTHIHVLHINGNIESNTRPCIMLNCFNKSTFNFVCELCILTILLCINSKMLISCNCKHFTISSSPYMFIAVVQVVFSVPSSVCCWN